ncbi:hypothetical protein ACHHYP_07834 [Achlya hypogyna]|uniref:Uncharacterized protein n=1 Tax=Achlya hypogyna TaxID=1202772 RepID=A0A1V9ZLG4_ACHHY|nr:hypothetical protein ACHHYP_07834 [Achlya hypogyna]
MQPPLHLRDVPGHVAEESVGGEAAEDSSGDRSTEEGYVWSNVHGHRVRIQDADDAAEYERILQELRANQPVAEGPKKPKKKVDVDERLAFPALPDDDEHVQLLLEEESLEASQWRPLRASDPADALLIDQQPDRVLLLDEIQPFLFEVAPAWHLELLASALAQLGVTPMQRAQAVPGLYADALDGVAGLCAAFFERREPLRVDCREVLDKLLLDALVVAPGALADPTKLEWLRRLLRQGHQHLRDPTARTRCLGWALELETHASRHLPSPDSATAFAKHVLALDPSWALYERYAHMELRLGNVKMATRICDKTAASLGDALEKHRFLMLRLRLEMATTEPCPGWRCLYLLYCIYHPSAEPLAKACKRLAKLKAPLEQLLSPAMREALRRCVRRDAQLALDDLPAAPQRDVPVAALCLFHALLVEAVLDGCRPHTIRAQLDAALAALPEEDQPPARVLHGASPSAVAREWLLAAALELLDRAATSPRDWRATTHLAIATVPTQPVFALLFVDAEKNNAMAQQVRRFVQDTVRRALQQFDAPAPEIWLLALLAELYRAQATTPADGGCCARHAWGAVATQRLRQLFEDAVAHASWRSDGCAVLWRLYLRFEIAVGQVDRAIKVLYRAIHKCPWSKALYLDTIRVLRPYVATETVQEILGWLVAKEIYLRYEAA